MHFPHIKSQPTAKTLAAAVAAIGVAASVAIIPAGQALAAPSDGRSHGQEIKGQAYQGKAAGGPEWMGTYKYSGGEAWCVSFALMEPQRVEQSGAKYVPAGELKKKNGDKLNDEEHSITSYAVAQGQRVINDPKASKGQKSMYGQAVAFILHKYTAQGLPLGGNQPSDKVGYDSVLHDKALPDNVRALKNRLITEGKAAPGPWKLEVIPVNDKELQVGKETPFKVSLKAANGKPIQQKVDLKGIDIDGVPASVDLNNAGEAEFNATPKAKTAKIEASTDAAPGHLQMLKPSKGNGQNIVKAGPHNIKSSTTTLTASEFGAVVLTKITSGDNMRKPVEGAEVSIYKKEDLDKAGLSVGKDGFDVTDGSSPSASSTQDDDESPAPSSSESAEPDAPTTESEAPESTEAEADDPDAEPAPETTTTKEEDGTRQDDTTETTESSAPSSTEESTPSTSSAPSSSETPSESDDSDRGTMPDGVGFSTVDSSNVEKLEGNSQKIIDKLKSVKPIATVTTDGVNALRGRMAPGEYVAVETKAPNGLALDSKPVAFTVETNKDSEVLLQNTVKAKLVKVDKATGKKLPGATYDIKPCAGNEVVASMTTDAKGEAAFTLPQGCYQAVEKTAPEGYQKNDTPQQFELTRDNTAVEVADIPNEKPAPRKVEKRVPVKKIPSGPTNLAPGALPEVK